jgi:phosphoadenosine phosphosulfate reductase
MDTELLPGFEPSEQDLVNRALAQPLERKIERAKLMLQNYEAGALKLSPDGYYLAFSGGKDSCVIKQLAIEAGVKFAPWYNLTTIDPPELVRFIKREHSDVRWNRPALPMLRRLVEKTNGPPSRLARWCCEEYKEQGGVGRVKVIGVRVSESARRAAMWREFQPHRRAGAILAPIVY